MKSREGCEYGEHWSTIWTGGARLQFPTPSEGNSHEPQHWPASGGWYSPPAAVQPSGVDRLAHDSPVAANSHPISLQVNVPVHGIVWNSPHVPSGNLMISGRPRIGDTISSLATQGQILGSMMPSAWAAGARARARSREVRAMLQK